MVRVWHGANRCQSPRLRPNLQDADTVVSLAWAPAEEELLVAGLASGFLVLWVSLSQILGAVGRLPSTSALDEVEKQ